MRIVAKEIREWNSLLSATLKDPFRAALGAPFFSKVNDQPMLCATDTHRLHYMPSPIDAKGSLIGTFPVPGVDRVIPKSFEHSASFLFQSDELSAFLVELKTLTKFSDSENIRLTRALGDNRLGFENVRGSGRPSWRIVLETLDLGESDLRLYLNGRYLADALHGSLGADASSITFCLQWNGPNSQVQLSSSVSDVKCVIMPMNFEASEEL